MKQYYVYILANKFNGTLYIGVTSNLVRRVWQHKEKLVKGFTEKYGIDKLIYFETYNDIDLAIQREKSLKEWKREWKIDLVKRDNPQWRDLYQEII